MSDKGIVGANYFWKLGNTSVKALQHPKNKFNGKKIDGESYMDVIFS